MESVTSGQTIDYTRRMKEHLYKARLDIPDKHSDTHLYRAIRRYGLENFTFLEIFNVLLENDLNYFEQQFIIEYDSFENGYNLNIGGGSCSGFKHSEKTKDKIRHIKLLNNPTKGKPLSTEHKLKLSEAFTGHKNHFYGKQHSEETRFKISIGNKGKVVSDDVKQRLSSKNTGVGNPMYGSVREDTSAKNIELKGYRVVVGDREFPSMRKAAEVVGVSKTTIMRWLKSGKATRLPKQPLDKSKTM